MICLLDFYIVQNRCITYQVSHHSVYFHVMVVSVPIVRYFYYLISVLFKKGIKAKLAFIICHLIVCIRVRELERKANVVGIETDTLQARITNAVVADYRPRSYSKRKHE